jgi:hypothetical protein
VLTSFNCESIVEYPETDESMAFFKNAIFQPPPFPFRQYPDRREGIVPDREPVSAGARFDLISAYIENAEEKPGENSKYYNLGFYLGEASDVNVEVNEYKIRYKMEPLKIHYSSGFNTFRWPAKIPAALDIDLKKLKPLAKTIQSSRMRVVPIVLFYSKPLIDELKYTFALISKSSLIKMNYKIFESRTLNIVYSGELKDFAANEMITINWDAKDANQNRVESGLYILNTEAIYPGPPGRGAQAVTNNFEFYHSAKIYTNE